MRPSYLDSPYIQSLSEDVIGIVRQRVPPAHRRYSSGNKRAKSFQLNLVQRTASHEQFLIEGRSTLEHARNASKTKSSMFTSICSNKAYPDDMCTSLNTESREFVSLGQQLDLKQDFNTADEHRRKCVRLRQARYRKKLKNKPKDLEKRIRDVKDRIDHLANERKQILTTMSTEKTVWDAAVAYFRIFREGVHAPSGTRFWDMDELALSISPNVTFSDKIGLHELVNTWRTFTQYFPDVRIELNNLKQITKKLILATTTISFTVSQLSLRNAFPNLSDSIQGVINVSEKLQGQHLVIRGSTCFDWDDTIQRVMSIQSETDMVSILLHLLGNLEDVSCVLNVAQLSIVV